MPRPTSTFGLIRHVIAMRWQKTSGLTKIALALGVFAVASALTMRLACGLCGSCCARQAETVAQPCSAHAVADENLSEDTALPEETALPEGTQPPDEVLLYE